MDSVRKLARRGGGDAGADEGKNSVPLSARYR